MEATARHDAHRLDAPPSSTPDAGGGLFERMRHEGYRFDFYQAVRLLELHAAHEESRQATTGPRRKRSPVRFRPAADLAFPPADVKRIEIPADERSAPTVVATFMGLYGVDAPLPSFFSEKIAVDEAAHAPLRDFLDIFAHRFYELFYRAWKGARPELSDSRTRTRRYRALAGLAQAPESADVDALVPLAGRLAPRARGAEGLSGVLKLMFDLPVRIEQFVPRWVQVNRSPGLGKGSRLDGSGMLGTRVFDVSGKFRVRLGPMGLDRYLALLPGGSENSRLAQSVRTYVPGFLDFDAALQLRTETLPRLRLGDRQCRLGLTTAVGKPAEAILTRIVHAS